MSPTACFFLVERILFRYMDLLTVEKRDKIIKFYYRNGDSAVSTLRALRVDYGRYNRPTHQTSSNTMRKF